MPPPPHQACGRHRGVAGPAAGDQTLGVQAPQLSLIHISLYCHLPRFRAQMKMFRVLGYSVISLDDAAAGLRGEIALPPRPLVLTFDDAYVDLSLIHI